MIINIVILYYRKIIHSIATKRMKKLG